MKGEHSFTCSSLLLAACSRAAAWARDASTRSSCVCARSHRRRRCAVTTASRHPSMMRPSLRRSHSAITLATRWDVRRPDFADSTLAAASCACTACRELWNPSRSAPRVSSSTCGKGGGQLRLREGRRTVEAVGRLCRGGACRYSFRRTLRGDQTPSVRGGAPRPAPAALRGSLPPSPASH